jgi:hypothetical protein
MLDVLIDGHPLAPAPDLAQALISACHRADESGRIVVEIWLDGVPIDPDALRTPGLGAGGRKAGFVSAAPAELACTALEAAAALLDGLKPRHRAAAEAVRDGDIDPAMKELSAILTSWDQAKSALERSARMLGIGPGGPGLTGDWDTISDALASLAGRLAEIKRSLVSRDWAGLADVLEYDMDEQAGRFAGVLRNLARSSADARPS